MVKATLLALLTALSLLSCSNSKVSKRPAVATQMKVKELGPSPLLTGTARAANQPEPKRSEPAAITPASSPRIAGRVTLRKDSLFGKEFLYSIVVQSASQAGAYYTAARTNLLPVTFQRAGSRLQIIQEGSTESESDMNRPQVLVQSLPIVAEDAETLSVEVRKASPYLTNNGSGDSVQGKPLHSSWARSAEISPDGQYVMFETALTTLEGHTVLALESFFPRELVSPKGTEPIFLDSLNPLGSRYAILIGGLSWFDIKEQVKAKFKVAKRVLLPANRPIDYYLGRNTPKILIPYVTAGAEGWNRYSRKMWNRDIVKVQGLIPEGIKVGDPRFNLIYLGTDAASAKGWSSAASDPKTGIVVNSNVQIPTGLWKSSIFAWEVYLAYGTNGNVGTSVENHPANHALPGMSGQQYGLAKLKLFAFHEMGHSLGLDHNFKGSLAFDPDVPGSLSTRSVMDYSVDEEYVELFSSLESSDGPILEYDRQALSFLYNQGKDILPTDPVLPVCAEASEPTNGSLDPFCTMGDAGKDPVDDLKRKLELLQRKGAKLGHFISFPAALELIPERFDAILAGTASPGAVAREKAEKLFLAYVIRANQALQVMEKWYFPFDDNSYPNAAEELEARKRALANLHMVLETEKLAPDARAALAKYGEALFSWLERNGHKASLEAEKEKFADLVKTLEEDTLQNFKSQAFDGMKYHEKITHYLNYEVSPAIDFQKEFVETLSKYTLAQKLDSGAYFYYSKRKTAAKALHTYWSSPQWKSEVEKVDQELEARIKASEDVNVRQHLNDLIRILRTGS